MIKQIHNSTKADFKSLHWATKRGIQMKTLAIILIVDAILNAVLKIIIYKLQKDIDKEIAKGVEMMRESIRDEVEMMRKPTYDEDNK